MAVEQPRESSTPDTGVGGRAVVHGCTGCGACVKQCSFLQQVGDPGQVAREFDPSRAADQSLPFGCSLCGLCTEVCPEGLDPAGLFLELRRESVREGGGKFPQHRPLRDYERRGTSRRYSYYALPTGCDTVWFPGCALSGTRPSRVMDVYHHLSASIPGLGVVLDCCTKPSHDLGEERHFERMFGEMRQYLLTHGVRRVLVACPSCHQVFQRYGGDLETRTVYEVLDEVGLPEAGAASGAVTVHDPCVARFEEGIHRATRSLLEKAGLVVQEMNNNGRQTLCCGEGGAVECLSPKLARSWRTRRGKQANGRSVITYCAGCVQRLSGQAPTHHLLDLLCDPRATPSGRVKPARAPFTYWNRLVLKRRLRRALSARVTRERTLSPEGPRSWSRALRPLSLLEALVAAIVAVF